MRADRRFVPADVLRLLPASRWLRSYRRAWLGEDVTAGVITALVLVPQGMAYAVLAGLPPEVGLYASVAPPIAYALTGSSRMMSVGPVSLAAILVADALAATGHVPGDRGYVADAVLLAALSGVVLLVLGALRLGTLANFLSHPVLSGFTSAAALIIVASQLPGLTGIPAPSGPPWRTLAGLWQHANEANAPTFAIGAGAMLALGVARAGVADTLARAGLSPAAAALAQRSVPLLLVIGATALVAMARLDLAGVAIVGTIPAGLPRPGIGFASNPAWRELLSSAVLIALMNYVGSISVARVLARRRRQKVSPNQELVALGLSNLAAAFTGSMPVAGGLSRSVVNFAAGARTQAAAIVTALLVAAVTLWLTPWFHYLPKAVLAAIIVVSVAPLIDIQTLRESWRYDRTDTLALAATFTGVLAAGLEAGLMLGLALSVALYQWRSARPHIAIVGRVPGTEHYRNVRRHRVETWPELLLVRVDESLYFANAAWLDQFVTGAVADRPEVRHVVLILSAVNHVDLSALETLTMLAGGLREAGITVHLAEVKGPVMDRLRRSQLMEVLPPGRVFLSTEEAVRTLTAADARAAG